MEKSRGVPCLPSPVRLPTSPHWFAAPYLGCLLAALSLQFAFADNATYVDLRVPKIGDHSLHIISPTMLELVRINTKAQGAPSVDSWDWVNDQGVFVQPDMSSVVVTVNGQARSVIAVGFKRRPLYAPLAQWDPRIGNFLYLQLNSPVQEGQTVQVTNNGSLWPTTMQFTAVADPLRYSPAIHVNQEGYQPGFSKKAMVGYYLGSLGELGVSATTFSLVNAQSGATVFQGDLTLRQDVGYIYTPTPYQQVYQADFTSFTTPGEYRLAVPGLGASLPFRIDEGIGMGLARTYALGMLHQRSGFNVAMPFTRFTHAADHMAPASVPLDASSFSFTWNTIADYARNVSPDNPPQTAPLLTTPSAQLYPYVKTGPVDVSGGHFEAANYSKVAWNNAQVIHILMYAVDALPGVAALDNLGLPESGDGISDVLQEAKWEADCLAKMQDADGGFYYMIHPREREYEFDVLPENGDPQVVWPKNTATTAAAVAALVQCASSPRFKQAYPQVASDYMATAQLGWKFLTNALTIHGFNGAYQRIMHFDDSFTHTDDLAWAACELFLATGDPEYRNKLETWFPDPTDPGTTRWGWWRMYASYGNTVRSYASAVRSGRLQAGQLNPAYLAKCIQTITDCGNDKLRWSQDNAYGSSFPDATKRVRDAGWYYSTEQAFDLMVAQEHSPNPAYIDAILQNINFETGCNPVNITYLTGLGLKRQREVVDQYSANDRRALPKIGVPIGNIQVGFVNTWTYGYELAPLCSPLDGSETAPYPFYDRWSDYWNVSTEASTTGTARSYAVAVWLAAKTALANQAWRSTNANIIVPLSPRALSQPVTVSLQVGGQAPTGARIIWEARGQEPSFGGSTFTFTPEPQEGLHWIEAEVQWPDGRRAFATNSVQVSGSAPQAPELGNPQKTPGGGFSFQLSGIPDSGYVVEASTNLISWSAVSTNTLPASGVLSVQDSSAGGFGLRYYRAVKIP